MHDDGLSAQYTRDEIIDRVNADWEFAARLWAAFGFAQNPADTREGRDGDRDPSGEEPGLAFSDDDLAALAVFVGKDREIDPATQLAAARSIGQATARLAEWESEQIRELAADPGIHLNVEQLIDAVAQIHYVVWRRHLEGFLARASTESDGGSAGEVIVGFADIVGYTSLSRRLRLAELEALLEAFESAAHRIITGHDGHVVKSIGDAVMFTAPTAEAAASISFELHGLTSHGELPTLRIGIAAGPALTRMGDVFGEPVNIAARLAGAAHEGTTLIDQNLAAALETDPAVHLNHISSLSVRGYRRLKAHVLLRNRRHRPTAEVAVDVPEDGPATADLPDEKSSDRKRQKREAKRRRREQKARRRGAEELTGKIEADAAD
ncbi:MAG: adenylate/guanylate cyclase domain-containing protein [Gordonia sp. (in: high G+C Gram-positive bacteria)]|uniref:adenylate/guanylate cyclase domain-containing protein n=1 Tax=Gordonia sp. (in: high G+C Gram-positive bacteria) TaxID=84139 RepID=UPI0039E4D318